MMNRSISTCVPLCLGLVLVGVPSNACDSGSGSTTITALSGPSGATFQVTGLNSAGQLTGYFFGNNPAHAFFYDNGVVTDLGTLGGMISEGLAINSFGQIAGASYVPGNTALDAFEYSGGKLIDLGTLGGTFAAASLINDAGQLAGSSLLPNASSTTGFFYSNGSMISLGTLGGTYSSPFGLNNAGQVVGESALANGDIHAFISLGAGLTDLGTLGGDYSSAFAINDGGKVVGEAAVASSDVHGFVYANGVMNDLGTFGGTFSSSFLVNSNGQVIGIAGTAGDAETHAFFYDSGNLVDIGTFGGTSSTPNGLNNRGQVVGTAAAADGSSRAFLWQNGQLTDLNTLLAANSGWVLGSAQFINDAGRIVGTGTLNGTSAWFILDFSTGNNPPVSVAGPDQTVDCQAQATLDGSASSDPDNDTLTFEWSSGGNVLGTTAILKVSLPLGTNVVVLKVTDPCGASSQSSLNVVVVDTTPPSFPCPAPVSASADANCQAAVPNFAAQVTATATDNCTPAQNLLITQNPVAGTLVGLGSHPVMVSVIDASGNSSTCIVLFSVADTTAPTIVSTPESFTLSAGSDCQAKIPDVLANVLATDSCTPANQLIKSQSPAAGTLIGIGQHSILVTVMDMAGNSSSATVAFNVVDTTAPTILSSPSSLKVSADAHCQGAVPNVLSSVLASDNCTPANQLVMTQNPAAGTVLPSGNYSVVVTVTDAAGNSSTVNVPLQIVDTTAPSILSSPSSLKVSADTHCQGAVPNVLSAVVASDNCTPANQLVMTQNPAAGTILPSGSYSVVVTVTDAAGNTSSVTVPLQIVDTTAPTILSSPASLNVSADTQCQGAVPNVLGSVVASDNCTSANQLVMTQNPAAGTVLPSGSYSIVVTVTDTAGNSSSVAVPLQIVDMTPPVFLSSPLPIKIGTSLHCQGAVPNVLSSLVVSDNCTPASQIVLTQNPAAGVLLPGGSYSIVVTATDAAGNSSSINVPLEIDDMTAPVISSLTASPNTLSPPNHQMIPVTVTAVVSDNCDSAPVAKIIGVTCNETPAPGDIQITGDLTVNLAATKTSPGSTRIYTITVQCTDASGNSSTGQVIVTVPKSSGSNSPSPMVKHH